MGFFFNYLQWVNSDFFLMCCLLYSGRIIRLNMSIKFNSLNKII